MFSEGTRQRLEALNRGPLPLSHSRVAVPQPIGLLGKSAPKFPLRPGAVTTIPGLIRRGEVLSNDLGAHLRICLPLEQLWPGGESLLCKRHQHLLNFSGPLPLEGRAREGVEAGTRATARKRQAAADLNARQSLVAAFPNRLLLVDLETCGLSGSALFLVGLLHCVNERLCVELLLARDYSEEAAVLASLWRRLQPEGVVVTFNGKSFDWPMVVDRSRRHLLFRGTRPPAPVHIDLLHHARRRWKGQLPDCKLQTLEQHICRRTRTDDIPGHQIPAAYQRFVSTRCDREMNSILMHNAIDLVTMLDLAMRLAG